MTTILLVIHSFLALGLVIVILLQRSEGGALGIGGGSGGMMTARGQANLLTRATAILAALFIVTSLTLAIMASHNRKPRSILDVAPVQSGQPAKPAAPAQPGQKPAAPTQPAAPLGR
ncbi:MAG: preprotein translocase rane subunit [Pseudomonadota bacterium]|jgi:preprotein translocase subunit SecG